MISFAFYDELLSSFFKDFYEVSKVTRIRKNIRLHKGRLIYTNNVQYNSNIGQFVREANDA